MLTARFFRTAARLPSPARLIGGSRFSSTVYTKEHEYAKIAGDIATCGISNYAQAALGDVVFVSLPAVGASFKKGDVMAAVESVKAASDVYAPVSGVVSAVNAAVVDTPALVNSAAEGEAWFVKLKLAGGASAEASKLMDTKAYKAHCDADAAAH